MKIKWMLIVALTLACIKMHAQEQSNNTTDAMPVQNTGQNQPEQTTDKRLILDLNEAKVYALKYNRDVKNA